jgi:hypothetical protein
MLQDSKGYFILDAFVGLSLLIFVLGSTMPSLYRIYLERSSISQERYAVELLHNNLQQSLNNEPTELNQVIEDSTTVYNLDWVKSESEVELCISWESVNRRPNKICGISK